MNEWSGRFKHPAFWIATGFGSGLMRPAPGTWGTIVAVFIAWGVAHSAGLIGIIAITVLSIPIGIWSAEIYGQKSGKKDASEVVIDEFTGMWIALLPQSFAMPGLESPPIWIIVAFITFRFFDILKPWPIGWLDRNVPGGLGVMLDDIVAGIFTAIIMLIAISLWG